MERISLVELLSVSRKPLGPLERALRGKVRWSETLRWPNSPPAQYRGRDWSVAGRAFDYWLRAFLALGYSVSEGPVIVEALLMEESFAEYLDTEYMHYADGSRVLMRTEIQNQLQRRRDVLRWRDLESEACFENCVELGMMEALCRRGEPDNLSCHPDIVIKDLRTLAKVASERFELFAGAHVDLDPIFPHAVFAANGDFAIDDRLIDLKTTKDLAPPLAFVQVACYSLIEAWHRGLKISDLSYREAAVYSSRYGALGVVNLCDVMPMLSELQEFLDEAASQHIARFGASSPPAPAMSVRQVPTAGRSASSVLDDVLHGCG